MKKPKIAFKLPTVKKASGNPVTDLLDAPLAIEVAQPTPQPPNPEIAFGQAVLKALKAGNGEHRVLIYPLTDPRPDGANVEVILRAPNKRPMSYGVFSLG